MDPAAGHGAMAARAERAACLAACASAAMAAAKFCVGLRTNSLAVAASALDSGMDALASGANALALRLGRREPTRAYTFGYGKLESLAGLLQGVFITASGMGIAWAAADRLRHPESVQSSGLGAAALTAAAILSALLARFLRREARRTGTPLLDADASHYASDLASNGAALAALGLSRWGAWRGWDPAISILIAGWVVRGALRIAADALGEILDHGLPEAEIARVAEAVGRYAPDVRGFHDLRTRRSGHRRYFDFHVVLRPDLSFAETHALADRIIHDLEALWPGADVTVHADPEPDARLPYAGQG